MIAVERAEVVHIHHLAHLGLGCAPAARAAGAAVVLTLHDYHLACVRGQLVDRELARCPGPEATRCAACVSEHLAAPPVARRLAPLARRAGLETAGRAALRRLPARTDPLQDRLDAAGRALAAAHRLLAPSEDLARRFRALGLAHEVHVTDLPLVAPLSAAPPPTGPLRALFVGALIPTKGVEVLLRAWAALGPRGAELVLRGPLPAYDGQPGWEERVRRLVQETPMARWEGPFSDAERQAVYAGADVLVLPSTWEENSPLVLREARAVGLRVVASRVGGVAEVDPEARLVPPSDVKALSAALAAELAIGRGRRPTARFEMDAHLEGLRHHYQDALRSAREPR